MNEKNPLAVWSLTSAAIAWGIGVPGSCAGFFLFPAAIFFTWVVFFGGSVVAVIFGHLGRSQVNAGQPDQGGQRMAAAGLAFGWAGVILNLFLLCLFVLLVVAGATFAPEIGSWMAKWVKTFNR